MVAGLWKRMGCFCLPAVFAMQMGAAALPEPQKGADQPPDSVATADAAEATDTYEQYLSQYEGASYPEKPVLLALDTALVNGQPLAAASFRPEKGDVLELTAPPATGGLYRIRIAYAYPSPADEETGNATFSLCLAGQRPFEEAAGFELPRLWKDAGPIEQDSGGNDRLPAQVQAECTGWYTLSDSKNLSREITVYVEAGQTLALEFADGGGVEIQQVELYNPTTAGYEEYQDAVPQAEGPDWMETLQAETNFYRNDSILAASTDRSGPQTMPSDPVKKRLNIISGTKWKQPGDAITWVVDVPEDGLYRLGLRWRQNTLQGLFVSRRLLVDGELLFRELGDIHFPYSEDWQYTALGGDSPYWVYLEKGRHTLTLEAVCGSMTGIITELNEAVYSLNTLYRRIIMVTGVTPDTYRDYNLASVIEGLNGDFLAAAAQLESIAATMEKESGQKGGQTSTVWQLADQLRSFAEDDATIPGRLEQFKSNISAVASLMASLQEQPLDLDYLTLSGSASTEEPAGEAIGFWGSLAYHVQAFVGSFFNDYTSVGRQAGESGRSIRAWVTGGREQAEILKQMIDEDFTAETGIRVELQLVQISLSQAVLAKTAPDVMLGTTRGQPVNLGVRGVLADLSELEGFEELRDAYTEKAFVPYSLDGKTYGLPITMGFHMMFIRTDVFEELGLEPPETWDEFYTIISRIQRANMTIGLPYTVVSSQGSIDAGMGARDMFPTFLLQKGGQLYDDANRRVALDQKPAVDAFEEWVTLYTEYQLDTQFDFYNRFRTGEMPIGISDYSLYNTLSAATPELKGMWEMFPIPGTPQEDGTIDRSEATSGTAAVILKDTADLEASWELLKWWGSAEVQAAYGQEQELLMGKAARYAPANLEAIAMLPWTGEELAVLQEQIAYLDEIPEVVGGYYTARGLDNAFRNVLFNNANYREALLEQMAIINTELARKQKEFGM